MAGYDRDEVPMLSDTHPALLDEILDSQFQASTSHTRSVSISIPVSSLESYEDRNKLVDYTGPWCSARKTSSVQMSGPDREPESFFQKSNSTIGISQVKSKARADCEDNVNAKAVQHKHSRASSIFKIWSWNSLFVMCCSVPLFLDPLYFFFLSVEQDNKCIVINWPIAKAIMLFRGLIDVGYLAVIVHKAICFRIGARELDNREQELLKNYFKGWYFVDLFVWLPLPQIMLSVVRPINLGSFGTNYAVGSFRTNFAKDLLKAAVLIQYIRRLFRFLPLLVGRSPIGQIFETAWPNFFYKSLHLYVVCTCHWFMLVPLCVTECKDGNASNEFGSDLHWKNWTTNEKATACFSADSFAYGIYKPAVNLTSDNGIKRYVFSLFWGLQQISTLAGNQQPSYFYGEILFTMLIIGLGLLLFAFLIGNMQNFLQALGRRRLEFTLRQRDYQQWMSHRRLPQKLRRRVLEAERYNWSATRGVNEGMLIENLPEDLQRDIRRHVFKFVETVGIFDSMDGHILDAICERLKQTIYIKGSEILYPGGVVDKMVFIVHGKLESFGEDGHVTPLCEGSVCGEEFLTWFVQHASVSKDGKQIKVTGQRLLSNRTVRCLSNVEAFSLRAADLEEVTHLYLRSLRNPRVQRDQSPYWRCIAPTGIQVGWRCRRRRLRRGSSSETSHPSKN